MTVKFLQKIIRYTSAFYKRAETCKLSNFRQNIVWILFKAAILGILDLKQKPFFATLV